MAIKGLVDVTAYEVGDYVTPETYTTPTRDIGDYVDNTYAAVDYVFDDGQNLRSQFTLSADGIVFDITATLISTFTVSCEAEDLDLAEATANSAFALSADAQRIRHGQATVATTISATADANVVYDPTKSLTITATQSADGNRTRSSGVINLIGAYTQIQTYTRIIEGRLNDYTWDTFAEDTDIDESWDDWTGTWSAPGAVYVVGTASKVLGGFLARGTANPQTVSQLSANASVDFSGSANITAALSTAAFFDRFRDIVLSGTAQSFDTAFTADQNGNAIFNITGQSLDAVFDQQSNASVTFDLGYQQNITAAFDQQSNASVTFDLAYGQDVDAVFTQSANGNALFAETDVSYLAFASKFAFGRLIVLPDPWNILAVPQELRTFVLPAETGILPVSQETRVNTVEPENRGLIVPQETRSYRIFKPLFTNRSSIPKVRQDING